MVAWLRKKAECPTCRASVWPVHTNNVLFHPRPSPAAVIVAAAVGAAPAPAAVSSDPPSDSSRPHSADALHPQPAAPSIAAPPPHPVLPSNSPAPSSHAVDTPCLAAASSNFSVVPGENREADVLHTDVLTRAAAEPHTSAAAAAAAPASHSASARDAASGARALVAAAADAEVWTPVLRRRRRRAADAIN